VRMREDSPSWRTDAQTAAEARGGSDAGGGGALREATRRYGREQDVGAVVAGVAAVSARRLASSCRMRRRASSTDWPEERNREQRATAVG